MDRFPLVQVRTVCGGRGVFAIERIPRAHTILEFRGPRVDLAAIAPIARAGGHDGFLQIGDDCYIGLSGGADDFVNHSCAPNAFVLLREERAILVALRDIAADEQLSFDYALTQVEFPFRFQCLCGTDSCRGEIGDFDEIPREIIESYAAVGAIPPHLSGRLQATRRLSEAL